MQKLSNIIVIWLILIGFNEVNGEGRGTFEKMIMSPSQQEQYNKRMNEEKTATPQEKRQQKIEAAKQRRLEKLDADIQKKIEKAQALSEIVDSKANAIFTDIAVGILPKNVKHLKSLVQKGSASFSSLESIKRINRSRSQYNQRQGENSQDTIHFEKYDSEGNYLGGGSLNSSYDEIGIPDFRASQSNLYTIGSWINIQSGDYTKSLSDVKRALGFSSREEIKIVALIVSCLNADNVFIEKQLNKKSLRNARRPANPQMVRAPAQQRQEQEEEVYVEQNEDVVRQYNSEMKIIRTDLIGHILKYKNISNFDSNDQIKCVLLSDGNNLSENNIYEKLKTKYSSNKKIGFAVANFAQDINVIDGVVLSDKYSSLFLLTYADGKIIYANNNENSSVASVLAALVLNESKASFLKAEQNELEQRNINDISKQIIASCETKKEISAATITDGFDKVYFEGWTTSVQSEEEHSKRIDSVQQQYPFEDETGQRYKKIPKYKTVQTKFEKMKIVITNNSNEPLKNCYLLVSDGNTVQDNGKIAFESLMVLKKDNTSSIDSNESWSIDLMLSKETENSYEEEYFASKPRCYLLFSISDRYQILKAVEDTNETIMAVACDNVLLDSLVAKNEDVFKNKQSSESDSNEMIWRANKEDVALRFVNALIDQGILISAVRIPEYDSSETVAFAFTFKTQAGLIRENAGFIYLEPEDKGWVVKKYNIDGSNVPFIW